MDIQLQANSDELLLFVSDLHLLYKDIQTKETKENIVKNVIMFLIGVMLIGTNYHRTHPGE